MPLVPGSPILFWVGVGGGGGGARREWALWQFCHTAEESLKNALVSINLVASCQQVANNLTTSCEPAVQIHPDN